MRMKQPTLRWPIENQGERKKEEERETEMLAEQGEWVEGCEEEDNERYRIFLKYCEERRLASKRQIDEDEERKREAARNREEQDLLEILDLELFCVKSLVSILIEPSLAIVVLLDSCLV